MANNVKYPIKFNADEFQSFIDECQHNATNNKLRGFENCVDLDYVISRLYDIAGIKGNEWLDTFGGEDD